WRLPCALVLFTHGNKQGPRPWRAPEVLECHRVNRNVVGKSILADESGVRSIQDRLSVYRVDASGPFWDAEIGVDKSHGTVLRRAHELQHRITVWRALPLTLPFPVAPPRG